MRHVVIVLFTWIFYSRIISAVERVWFIRHCDKPRHGPCCSEKGYERASNWHKSLIHHQVVESNLTIYTSGTQSKSQCPHDPPHLQINHQCPHSHRMLITANIIHQALPFSKLRDGYCVGQMDVLLSDVLDDPSHDVLVVWQHEELMQMVHIMTQQRLLDFPYDKIVMVNVHTRHFPQLQEEKTHVHQGDMLSLLIPFVILAFILHLLRQAFLVYRRRRPYQVIHV